MNTTLIKTVTAPQTLATVDSRLISEFIKYVQVSKNSQQTYLKGLKNFYVWCTEQECTTPGYYDILAYKTYLTETYAPNTANLYLTAVKVFYEWYEVECAGINVAKGVKRIKTDNSFKKDYLTAEECKRVLNGVERSTLKGVRDYAILSLMFTTGLRCVEVTTLTQSSIIKSGNNYKLYVLGKGKNEPNDFVVLPAVVKQQIDIYNSMRPASELEPLAPLFASVSNNNHGGKLTVCAISGIVKQSFRAVNLNSERLTAHSTRHTAITLALINGATIQQAQTLARHKSINTTLIYAHNLEKAENPCADIVANELF